MPEQPESPKLPGFPQSSTRRSFLRQTVGFSALAAMSPAALSLAQTQGGTVQSPPPDPKNPHLLMLGDWGTDKLLDQQTAVADAMKRYVDQVNVHPQATLLLGDNWYGTMVSGHRSPRWQTQFELMYPASHFPGPFYAVLGNHDYEFRPDSKVDVELRYASLVPGTRWTMPANWYTLSWPAVNPQIKFIFLDSNLPGVRGDGGWNPFAHNLAKDKAAEQDAWFRAELAKPRTTPYVACVAHHPLYTNGIHRDTEVLIKDFDELLKQYKVDFWISGHDHDLQHLEFAGHPTSFWISGGGGAELVDWTTPPEKRGPYGGKVLGFSGLEATPQGIVLRHFDKDLKEVHAFRKTPDHKVELFAPRAVPVKA